MDTNTKQKIISEFTQFVEDMADTEVALLQDENTNCTDIFTLYKEFIALKTEVKQESRQFKVALESFKDVFSTLEKSHTLLANEVEVRQYNQRFENEKQKRSLLMPLLLELIDLRDRLERGLIYNKTYNPKFLVRFFLQHEIKRIKKYK